MILNFNLEQATAEASMQILFTDSFNFYTDSMQKSINKIETYLKLNELITLHHNTKTEALAQVWKCSKALHLYFLRINRYFNLNYSFF